jgi:nucleotide-binding universal stress UspA family protein
MENHMKTTNVSSLVRPKSILVATDLHDLHVLLPVAIDQAGATGAAICLLHVIPPISSAANALEAYPLDVEERQFRDAEATLSKLAQQVRDRDLACTFAVRRWSPVEEITRLVAEQGIERLIVGTSSRRRLDKLFIGSVAEELIRTLDIPVCTVGPQCEPCAQDTPRRMIVALSLRHHPEHSLAFAAGLAANAGAELTVLHIAEPHGGDECTEAGAWSRIDELLRTVKASPVLQVRIRSGEPAEEIIGECLALKPQSLILSASAASIAVTKFHDGVAYRVIAQAPCPTFTLHSGAKVRAGANYREFSASL